MLKLIKRSKLYVKGYKEYCQEFHDNNIKAFIPTNPINIDENWFERTAQWYADNEKGLNEKQQKSFHYWAIDNERFIGEFQLRPELTDELIPNTPVVPSFRAFSFSIRARISLLISKEVSSSVANDKALFIFLSARFKLPACI